jgi:hypothetical protein
VRADEARRRLDFSRSLVLGSILGKRILDLFVVICLLLVGGAWLPLSGAGAVPAIFGNFALNAALLGGALGAGVMLLPRLCRVGNFTFGTRMSSDQTRGLGSVGESRGAEALAFTFAIWSREALSLWLLVAAFGISLAPAQLGLLVAVSSAGAGRAWLRRDLSACYVFVFATFRLPAAIGLLAATTAQVLLFGSVARVAVVLCMISAIRSASRHPMAFDATPAETTSHA